MGRAGLEPATLGFKSDRNRCARRWLAETSCNQRGRPQQ